MAMDCLENNACYIGHAIDVISDITRDVQFWSRVEVAAAVAAGVCGVIATIMIALQGDDNKYWTRPVGIIATSLVTGITALTTSFHIPENVNKLIDLDAKFTIQTNNFEHDIRGKSGDEADEIRKKFADDFMALRSEQLRV